MENKKNNRIDYLINEAISDVFNEMDEELKSKNSDGLSFSKEHEKKMKHILNKERNKNNIVYIEKIIKRIAIIIIAFIFVSFTCIFSVEAWRARFLNFIMDKNDSYIEFNYRTDNFYSNDNIKLVYIPEHFKLIKDYSDKSTNILRFQNDEDYFMLYISADEGKTQIDLEGGEVKKESFNGRDYFIINKNNIISIYWHDNYFSYTLSGNIEESELIKISYNIEKK